MLHPALDTALRKILRLYTRYSPIQKGKGWLVHVAAGPLWPTERPLIESVGSGYRMALNPTDYVERCVYFFGYYELAFARWLEGRLRPGMVFCDVGAHVGQYTLMAAAAVGEAGRVYAFEPEPRNFGRLRSNVELNGFRNVFLHQCAVSDVSGGATFYVHSGGNFNSGNHSLRPDPDLAHPQAIVVRTVTLADALLHAPKIDMIKIDVEGAEMLVLRGAEAILVRDHPIVLFEAEERQTTRFGYSTIELKRYVSSLGYAIYRGRRAKRTSGLEDVLMDEIEQYAMLVAVPE
ncbi:MAG: FkbM family methyltransferase [Chloroflexi bacterium]|nr:FkbM family methyltransferase [Chloroflexota bacterium]